MFKWCSMLSWNGSYSCTNSCAGGTYCNGQPVGGGSHGTQVCGGSNWLYTCNNGSWTSGGAFCNMCGTSVTTNSISYPGPTANIGWSAVGNINRYRLRINDTTVSGWTAACNTDANGGQYCADTSATSYSWIAIPGHTYSWWVDACGANDVCTAPASASVTAPINGSCSTSLNSCTAGTYSDRADSATQYLWDCVGSNGGSTASCSQNIPISGSCGATVDSCTDGTYSDRADSPTQYLWSCVGSNVGSTASCSQDVPAPASPYFKLKDTSFYKLGSIINFPAGYSAYDSSDTFWRIL